MTSRAEMQAQYLAEVETTYAILENNFDDLYASCPTPEDRVQLRNLHAAARDAYWRGVATSLQDGNQVVREIYADLADANQQIKYMLANLENIGGLLGLLKQAVRLAGSLITLAAA
jgi:hypothetical protein